MEIDEDDQNHLKDRFTVQGFHKSVFTAGYVSNRQWHNIRWSLTLLICEISVFPVITQIFLFFFSNSFKFIMLIDLDEFNKQTHILTHR